MSEHQAREGCRRGRAFPPAPAAQQLFSALQLWAVLDAHLLCAAGLEGWIIEGVSVQLPQTRSAQTD